MTVKIGTVVSYLLTGYSVVGTLAACSKAWVCSHSLVGIVGSNPAGGHMDVCSECCASGRSLVRRSPTECGVSECDHED